MDLRDVTEFLKDTFKYIIVIVIVLFIAIYVVSLAQVVGPSMKPTYVNGDIVIIDKVSYRFKDINRGDIIALNNDSNKNLIKRVIGLPGETINIKNNRVYINGEALEEEYISSDILMEDFKLKDIGYGAVPEGYYFVLGDNRENSQDSRDKKVGLIKKEDIIGKVFIKIWPLF